MWIALRFTLITWLLAGIAYPLFILLAGQILFPYQANGSLIPASSQPVVGSALIGQAFSRPDYFHSRPSANHYDATNSGGSNWGATNRKLITRIQQDAWQYQHDNQHRTLIPADAVTASGSGLDPHITLANALAQIPRIARVRKLDAVIVQHLVQTTAEHPWFGEAAYVNVLKLNLALDHLSRSNRQSSAGIKSHA